MNRKLCFILLRMSLIPFLIRELIQRKRVTIIVYHAIKPDIARAHFNVLKSKYNIIELWEYVHAVKSGKVNELPPKSLIITFDDGHKSNYDLKGVFEKHNIRPTIFLCSGLLGTNRHFWWEHVNEDTERQYLKRLSDEARLEMLMEFGFEETKEFGNRQCLSKREIETMKRIVDFQSHTMFHPILPQCSDERVFKEISDSREDLEHNYGLSIYALSYPNGDYSDREVSIAKKTGYECGITLDVGFNCQHTDLFRIKRICIPDSADTNELLVKACGVWDYVKNIFKGVPDVTRKNLAYEPNKHRAIV